MSHDSKLNGRLPQARLAFWRIRQGSQQPGEVARLLCLSAAEAVALGEAYETLLREVYRDFQGRVAADLAARGLSSEQAMATFLDALVAVGRVPIT